MNITIIGLGLIGSSLAWQLTSKGLHVRGFARRQATIDKALKLKLIREGSTRLKDVIKDAQIVVICVPVEPTIDYIRQIESLAEHSLVVTDVGSVKEVLLREVSELDLKYVQFVGGHPMAGSEKQGIDHYIEWLFKDKPFVFCYPKQNAIPAVKNVLQAFTRKLEANYMELPADLHDQIVAGISHLPYVLAVALYKRFLKDKDSLSQLASTGFQSLTRIAHSDPNWGLMIAKHNRANLISEIEQIQEYLTEFKTHLQDQDNEAIFGFLDVEK